MPVMARRLSEALHVQGQGPVQKQGAEGPAQPMAGFSTATVLILGFSSRVVPRRGLSRVTVLHCSYQVTFVRFRKFLDLDVFYA